MPDVTLVAPPDSQPAPQDYVERGPGCCWAVVSAPGATFVYWDFDPDYDIPRHNHPHAQCAIAINGNIDLIFDDQTVSMQPGQMLYIPPFVYHKGHTTGRCIIIDAFVPNRAEYEAEYRAQRGG